MEYPYGHHTHHSHRNDDDDEENNRQNYPPHQRPGFDDYPPPQRPGFDNHPPPQRPGFDNHPPPQRPGFDNHPPPQRPGFDDYPPPQRPGFEDYPPPQRSGFDQPPPPYRGGEDRYGSPPPPRPTAQVYHSSHAPPPQAHSSAHYGFSDPPPQAHSGTTVHHVAHEPDPDRSPEAQSHRPHLPSFMHHKTHETSGSDLSSKPTYKVYCKADPNLHLTVRDDKVVLAPSDPNNQYQNWYKDEKFSTRVKDKEGFPSFALVNKATGQAVKHSVAASHPVQLAPYNADVLDQSVLWTESKDLGDGYRTVRMVNNIKLSVDAFQGAGVGDGTTVGVWEWNRGNNQRWRITLH